MRLESAQRPEVGCVPFALTWRLSLLDPVESAAPVAPALLDESQGQWALVLGASAGTGAAVARALAIDPGLDLFCVHRGRYPAFAAELERNVMAAGRRMTTYIADASTAESARLGVAALLEQVGPRKVRVFAHAIANASVGMLASGGKILEPHQLEKSFNSMAHSFVHWVRELVARDALAPSARLIGFSNPVVGSLVPGLAAIAAGKAALEIYVRQLAIELGPLGHRVNLVNFGLVDTYASRVGFPPERWEHVKERASLATPARRLCTVEEVGRFVSVLAGDAGAWFNGATIDFTGGMTQGLLGTVLNQR